MESAHDSVGHCTLHLLDAAQGHPVQTWRFANCQQISIGRSDDNDIALADAQVSRKHVELVFRDGSWTLQSHGRNGTRIDNELVQEILLWDSATFQMGMSGPTFQFVQDQEAPTNSQTIEGFDQSGLDALYIDERRVEEEVGQITESEAFRQLQQHLKRLMHGTDHDSGGTSA
jgi:pSer/pThr/pTyr-binding forkhead associated (FHA) protein